jgi:glutamate-1-semialdehyde 2,1-aminomutase
MPAQSLLLQRFAQKTPNSRAFAERARQVMPGGVSTDVRLVDPYLIATDHAQGSRKWDLDGNEYVDYACGHGALLFGHADKALIEAVSTQVARGTHFATSDQSELRWAEAIQWLMPSCERVRLTSSGTEATLLAMRLARAHTRRRKILRFNGHYHGWHDHAQLPDPAPPGILPAIFENLAFCEQGKIDQVEHALEAGDVAAVILEPGGALCGKTPLAPAFLHQLRERTRAHRALLIFDEMVTGFRVSPGGMQGLTGVRPDLTTLGKIAAGGLPGGALGGSQEVMATMDTRENDPQWNLTGRVRHQGTFNGNPLSAVAGLSVLSRIISSEAIGRANAHMTKLRARFNEVLKEERMPWVVYGNHSFFHLFPNPSGRSVSPEELNAGACSPTELLTPITNDFKNRLRVGLNLFGVDLTTPCFGFASAAHTEADIDASGEAMRQLARLWKQDPL